jgi:hypothetical protein
MINLLELFAGKRSIGKAAEKLGGFNVFSVDWKPFRGVNLIKDIENLNAADVPFVPDMVWASTDCTTYTVLALSTHRNGVLPKTQYAAKCDRTNIHLLSLLQHWKEINPELVYFIENPRGKLRSMPFMQGIDRKTVWYCQYGDQRAKPTDIFTNSADWLPRPECFPGNKDCHHIKSPASRHTMLNSYDRDNRRSINISIIPEELCTEILLSVKNNCKE